MELGRRDLPKVGIFGSAADILRAARVARTEPAVGNRIAESRLPQPFASPPVRQPVRLDATSDCHSLEQKRHLARPWATLGFRRRRRRARTLGQRPPPSCALGGPPTMT
jgi:hypothetical protein